MMGCGVSTGSNAYVVPNDGEQPTPYYKLVETPGGSVVRVKGFKIDARLPLQTPGGTKLDRRDYDADPLTSAQAAV